MLAIVLLRLLIVGSLLLPFYGYTQETPDYPDSATEETLMLAEADSLIFIEQEREKAYQMARALSWNTTIDRHRIEAYKIMGLYHYYRYQIDSTLYYVHKGIDILGDPQDTIGYGQLSKFYKLLSQTARNRNLIKESKKWSIKGMEASLKARDTMMHHFHYYNLAVSYRLLGDPQRALTVFEKLQKSSSLYPDYYSSVALCYNDLKQYEKSIASHKKALEVYTNEENHRSIAITLLNIGGVYLEMHKDAAALPYFEQSKVIANHYGYQLIVLNSNLNIGEIYMADTAYEAAKQMYEEALEMAKEQGFFEQQLYSYERLQKIAEQQGDYQEALTILAAHNTIKDSLATLQNSKEINTLEVKYETFKKEQEILLLKKEQQLKQTALERQKALKEWIAYAAGIVLIPTIGFLLMYRQKLKAQNQLNQTLHEVNAQKLASIAKDHQLKVIEASVASRNTERQRIARELHDSIGGNLAAIKLQLYHVLTESDQQIYAQIDETCTMVRTLSHDLMPNRFEHTMFCATVESYLDTISDSSELVTTFSTFTRNSVDELSKHIQGELFKVLQELVTNTIKHAEASVIDVQINALQEQTITVLYEDNGKGFDVEQQRRGLGLGNIHTRIVQLAGKANIDSIIDRGTFVFIEIPIG